MAIKTTQHVKLFSRLAIAVLSFLCPQSPVHAGRPYWPPSPHSAAYRQANMFFLRFQDALASEHWNDALALCSDRVQSAAGQWPSPGDFFRDTMPVQHVLAKDFGCWSCGSNFFGMFANLTEPETTPVIQWFWAIYATNNTWVVDYPPAKLDDYITGKKDAIRARDEELQQIRQRIQPKLKDLKTHLVPVSEKFVLGSPMLFRVELLNLGKVPVYYQNTGVAFQPLTVLDHSRETVPSHTEPSQIAVAKGQLAPGASTVLAEKIDITGDHEITKPGTYFVQFDGSNLAIGEPVSPQEPGRFGENENLSVFDFVSVPARLPSAMLEIEITGISKEK